MAADSSLSEQAWPEQAWPEPRPAEAQRTDADNDIDYPTHTERAKAAARQ